MLESDGWSDPQSELTEELGLASKPAGAPNPSSFCTDFAAPRQRCVIPKVQPSQINGSDQRVPVYWDQTVPVWHAGGPSSTTKRKAGGSNGRGLQGGSSRRFEGGGASSSDTMSLENSGENCCCSSERDDRHRRDGDSSGRGDGGASNSSEVSFDAVLSMYESSLVEKSFKWSRRDWWVLDALSKPRHDHTRRGLWPRRTFAGRRRQFPGDLISVQLSASGALTGGAVDHDDVESLRRLRVAIESTSICDLASATCKNSHYSSVRLRNADAIFHGRHRSYDFQNRRDSLNFSTPMLTTSSW